MSEIYTFEKFKEHKIVNESYELVKDYMTYDEVNEMIGRNFLNFFKGNFIKNLFKNPIQKTKLDKLSKSLLLTKIELMRLEIEDDNIDSFKDQLSTTSRGKSDYETLSSKINTADKSKAIKIKTLQDREQTLSDQMNNIAKDSEKLQNMLID